MKPIETAETKARELAGRFSKAFTAPFEKDIQELAALFLKAGERDKLKEYQRHVEGTCHAGTASTRLMEFQDLDARLKAAENERDSLREKLELAQADCAAMREALESALDCIRNDNECLEMGIKIKHCDFESQPIVKIIRATLSTGSGQSLLDELKLAKENSYTELGYAKLMEKAEALDWLEKTISIYKFLEISQQTPNIQLAELGINNKLLKIHKDKTLLLAINQAKKEQGL